MDAVAGQLIAGRYRLAQLLGSGGFGRVWKAEDTVLGVWVAVKELQLGRVPPSERQELLVRAAREARHAARLRDHPHIVTVYDVIEVDAATWIIMRLVEGHSLAEQLRMNGPLTETRTRAIAQALLDALRFVHEADITHRDVKPANIMLTPQGNVLLTDFGIAVDRADTRLTRTDLVIGTPGYTAPERMLGAEPSGASDLYSLGVTLYEAVEGRLPFPPEEPLAALRKSPPPPRHAGRLAPLITSLLDGDPARRPTSAEAIALLEHHPDTPPTTPARERSNGKEQITVSLASSEIVPRVVKQQAQEGALLGALLGIPAGASGLGPAIFEFPNATRNHVTAGVVVFVITVLSKMLYGILRGESAKSDTIIVNHEGLTITRNDVKQTFTIRWSAVDRIDLGVLTPSGSVGLDAVRVWFREGSEPTRDWLLKHKISKQLPDKSFLVYRGDHEPHIPVQRLHEALRTFAGPRYKDVTDPPDPR
ncbi:serine/threonine-protein kinase [Streptomyces xanthochromogenes]|uniref:serine/threonine-protein kinase n=1 Tax=Streptomyces xanthochromogenes TaxID=67384 RepID=UPI0034225DCF